MKPDTYTADELVQILKYRQCGRTLQVYAEEIHISFQLLSQILNGTRSVGNQNVLDYLAPHGKQFVHKDQWELISGEVQLLKPKKPKKANGRSERNGRSKAAKDEASSA